MSYVLKEFDKLEVGEYFKQNLDSHKSWCKLSEHTATLKDNVIMDRNYKLKVLDSGGVLEIHNNPAVFVQKETLPTNFYY